jgi:hypothetical protein
MRRYTENDEIRFGLIGIRNRTLDPYLACRIGHLVPIWQAMHGILIPGMNSRVRALRRTSLNVSTEQG